MQIQLVANTRGKYTSSMNGSVFIQACRCNQDESGKEKVIKMIAFEEMIVD